MALDRTVIIRVSNNEWLRWKRNCGNISLTIRAVMDVHVHHIEETRKYQEWCKQNVALAEKEINKRTKIKKVKKWKNQTA